MNGQAVKPSASPSQVRILDLPLPAETSRGLRILRPVRPSASDRSGPAESSGVPLFAAVHGHIADSVGDHCRPIRPPGRVTSWAGPGSSMLRYPGCTAEIALHASALRLACHGSCEGLASLHVSATDLNAGGHCRERSPCSLCPANNEQTRRADDRKPGLVLSRAEQVGRTELVLHALAFCIRSRTEVVGPAADNLL
jgi:hypothetical protein